MRSVFLFELFTGLIVVSVLLYFKNIFVFSLFTTFSDPQVSTAKIKFDDKRDLLGQILIAFKATQTNPVHQTKALGSSI
jgi:hypothetical protein